MERTKYCWQTRGYVLASYDCGTCDMCKREAQKKAALETLKGGKE